MLVTIDHDGRVRPARLQLHRDTTASELSRAITGSTEPPGLCVDGVPVAADRPVLDAGVRAGAHLSIGGTAGPPVAPCTGPAVAVVGGLRSGARVALPPEPFVVGRARDADIGVDDPTVSCRHAELSTVGGELRITDLGSRNGTHQDPLDGTIVVGASRVRVERDPLTDGRTAGRPDPADGRVPLDRPPRSGPPIASDPVRWPARSPSIGAPPMFSWAMFLAPVAMGAVLAITVDPKLAFLSLLGPVVMAASWYEARRRGRRDRTRLDRRFRRDLERFRAELAGRAVQHRTQLVHTHPDPAEVVRRAVAGSRLLWERRPGAPDALHVRIGRGEVAWTPPLQGRHDHDPDDPVGRQLEELATEAARLTDAPVVLDLGRHAVVGLVGPSPAVAAIGRNLLIQLAVHHGPVDVACTTNDGGWIDLLRWLPHWIDPDAAPDTDPTGAHLVVVTSGIRTLSPGAFARELLERRGAGRTTVLVLVDHPDDLPASCSSIIETDAFGSASLRRTDQPGPPSQLTADGLPAAVAEHAARALARWRDPEHHAGARATASPRLLDLLQLPDPTPRRLRQRWETIAADRPSLATAIGVSDDGTVTLDLERDGPHALVAGTTGAGKSELLRTLVAGLAANHDPDEVTFLLVDFKGGSAFDACAELPHTVGVVTDLDGRLGERALRSLDAEVRRRERMLRDANTSDRTSYAAQRRTDPSLPALPRLVVVIDEFATLAHEVPAVLTALVEVARRGRSLGIHLVLATQRPAGVVSDHIRTNTALRIALRMVDAADSVDVIGNADASRLPARPGAALLSRSVGVPTAVQIASVSKTHVPPSEAVRVEWLDAAEARDGVAPDSTAAGDEPRASRDLDLLVDAAIAAWGTRPHPHRPWVDPLPRLLPLPATGAAGADPTSQLTSRLTSRLGSGLILGLADDPDHQTRTVLTWEPGKGPLVVAGAPGSGRSVALHTVVCAATMDAPLEELHVYAIAAGSSLDGLRALPHVGAVIDPDDGERVRLLRRLLDDHRRGSGPTPRLLLVVDGWRALVEAVDRSGGVTEVDAWYELLGSGRIELAVSVDRLLGLPAFLAAAHARVLLRMTDPFEYASAGVTPLGEREVPAGRGVDARTGLEVQFARAEVQPPEVQPPESRSGGPQPDPLTGLVRIVTRAELLAAFPLPPADRGGARLVLGRGHGDATIGIDLTGGEHLLVSGMDGTGRSTTLLSIAIAALEVGIDVIATGPARSPLRTCTLAETDWIDPSDVSATVACRRPGSPTTGRAGLLLLVDDVDLLPGDEVVGDGFRSALAETDVAVVAAAHADRIRSRFGHWTEPLRLGRYGLALGARPHDGELWCTAFPSDAGRDWPPGRAYLVDHGQVQLIQIARP